MLTLDYPRKKGEPKGSEMVGYKLCRNPTLNAELTNHIRKAAGFAKP